MNNPEIPYFDHKPKPYSGTSYEKVLELRKRYLTPALMTYYRKPIMVVEGAMQYVYDEKGRRYLDAFGGIVTISVGHCHPYVIEKIREQLETLQHTTTIYLHPVISEYAQMLAEKLPGDLSVCYFVNSGSEANDLALLMARLYTGNYDVIALRNAYHGGSSTAMGLTAQSTWKYNYPHNFGIHHALNPNPYRGPWGYNDPKAGAKYAADVRNIIEFATPGRIAGFFAESIQGVGGAVVYPEGYLAEAYGFCRQAGGVCIADEVQTGFGRTGAHFWGFEAHGVIPDIVTMAKGIGNGVPLAAVVTTPQIAYTLAQRIHFNTFGGNPVSCAAGKAVLEVIENEGLQNNSLTVGNYLIEKLNMLSEKHDIIGDVRGLGLMTGIELVRDRKTKTPAKEECTEAFERAKDMGLLVGRGGLYGNVIRIKPPMCIKKEDVDFLIAVLDSAFSGL
ncbi:MAG: aminotransferase class III-fold pyridoxal phosphate-dependent enzyme [Deltaproteobacteria bacterium]|nr:aminotransferase class III-fold pyridoxal phosphate-dependent enzyme [Deltaproteobacteria bacterium]